MVVVTPITGQLIKLGHNASAMLLVSRRRSLCGSERLSHRRGSMAPTRACPLAPTSTHTRFMGAIIGILVPLPIIFALPPMASSQPTPTLLRIRRVMTAHTVLARRIVMPITLWRVTGIH